MWQQGEAIGTAKVRECCNAKTHLTVARLYNSHVRNLSPLTSRRKKSSREGGSITESPSKASWQRLATASLGAGCREDRMARKPPPRSTPGLVFRSFAAGCWIGKEQSRLPLSAMAVGCWWWGKNNDMCGSE